MKICLVSPPQSLNSFIQQVYEKMGKEISLSLCILGLEEGKSIALPSSIKKVYSLPPAQVPGAALAIYHWALGHFFKEDVQDLILFPGDKFCNSLAPMVAATLDYSCFSDIIDFSFKEKWVLRKVYGSNLEAKFPASLPLTGTMAIKKQECALALTEFSPKCISYLEHALPWLGKAKQLYSPAENLIKKAKILFVAGKGIGSKENCQRLERIAQAYGGEMGVSRAVVLAGWADAEYMIGQSGIIAAPELCITLGVSGSAPFMVGIEQAQLLIAINNDPLACIFHHADCAIPGDCESMLALLEKSLD